MKYKDFFDKNLLEIKYNPTDVNIEKGEYEYVNVDGLIYMLCFDEIRGKKNERGIELKFRLKNPPKLNKSDFKDDISYELALLDKEISIVGVKNQFKVFSKILSAFGKRINELKPDFIKFNAVEKSRRKLYKKFIKFMEKHIPYKESSFDIETGNKIKDGYFFLIKNENL